MKAGFFPPVVPGTKFVTIGGAVASDIHGKSHHVRGTFSNSVIFLELLDANLEARKCYPQGPTSEIFWATAGGMGLTGIILSVAFQLIRVESAYVEVKNERVSSLSELIEKLIEYDKIFEYTVAWIDVSGKFLGRGIVSGANHSKIADLTRRDLQKSCYRLQTYFSVPCWNKVNWVNRHSVRLFNALWYRKRLKNGHESLLRFVHPLDFIGNWNRIYGKAGIIEWQFSIPLKNVNFMHEALRAFQEISASSFLGVIKTFGSESNSYLGFTQKGISFSVDIPADTKGILDLLETLDQKLTKIGGRIYLTKDSRLSKVNFQKMYPNLNKWLTLKSIVDPRNRWESDQSRRLGLNSQQRHI